MELGKLITSEGVNRRIFLKGYLNFRISQIGRCHRSVQYGVLGVKQDPVPEKTKNMWNDRLKDEARIIKKLSKKYKIRYTGENQRTYYRKWEGGPKVIFSGTPDGLIKYGDEWIPLEIKSLNPFRFETITSQEKLSREYLVQIQGEIILAKAQKALYVIGNSKTKTDIKEFIVSLDERIFPWIEERVNYICRFVNRGHWIYPEFFPGSDRCRWCLFKTRCKEDIYKGWKLVYNNETKEIDKEDFDFWAIEKLDRDLKGIKEEYKDVKMSLLKVAHELKGFFLKKRADKLVSKKFELSLDEINKILEEAQV